MSEEIAKLGLFVDSSGVIRATKKLRDLEKQSGRNEKKNQSLKTSFIGVKSAAAALAGSLVLKHFISTAAAFETMKISLETVTGSAEKANAAFEGIKDFAANTPFSVEEVTQSFIKLKALGIEPTEANLRSFGNTSASMGKSLNQLIEAVADAATGEFERLKEFGIKASKEGDKATFTFKGVSTTVKNTSEEITGYLQTIGENEFGGAMAKQMDTVNGAISNAGDSIDDLADALGEGGLNEVVKSLTLSFSALVSAAANFIRGDNSVSGLEMQIDAVTESIFDLQSAIEEKQENNFFENLITGSAEDAIEVVGILEARLAALQAKLETAKGNEGKSGIDEGGKGGNAKRAAELAAEQAQNEELLAISQNFLELKAAQTVQSKLTQDEEILNLQRIANEQMLVEQATAETAVIAKQEEFHKQRKEAISGTLDSLSSLTASSSKKLFKLGKAASIASAVVNTHEAITKTMANTPYPFNIPLAAAQGLAGFVQVQNIRSQQFSGQAHDGLDNVPRTGTYLLEQGEAVIKKQEAGKIRAGNVGGGGVTSITFAPVIQAFDAEDVMKNKDALFNDFRERFSRWMNEEGVSFA